MTQITSKTIAKNVLLSVSAQIVSLFTSFLLNLIVPKYIPEIDYSMWQTYVLYASFVGICHLGLLDGFVLKYSKYDYDDLNKEEVRSHFVVLILILTSLLFVTLFIGNITASVDHVICALVSIAILVKNLCVFALYTLQTTNRISSYAKIVIAQRMLYAILVGIFLIYGINDFRVFCIADLFADFTAFAVSIKFNRLLYFGKIKQLKSSLPIVLNTIACGSVLMLANFSNNFIIGSCKIVIERLWDKLTFGQVSFAFSITNLFLTFVISISVVLFPSIKRMEESRLPSFYSSCRTIVTQLLYIVFLLFFPGSYLLKLWVPHYSESIEFLSILFPIILYTTRTTLLTNNYLRAFRLERKLFLINLVSVIIEILGLLLIVSVCQNIKICLLWTVVLTFIKTVSSEYAVCKVIKIDFKRFTFQEVIVCAAFIIGTTFLASWTSFILTLTVVLSVSFINRNLIVNTFINLRRK